MSGCSRSPFGTLRLPEGALEEIDSIVDADGRTLRRYRIKATGQVLTEVRAKLIRQEVFEIKPMELPVGLCFFLKYQYGKKSPEET